jgi:hypothetical protein
MTKTIIHSLTSLYVNVDVNFARPRSYATGAAAWSSLFCPLLQTFVSSLVKGA